jgi:ubiquitin-protein ligase
MSGGHDRVQAADTQSKQTLAEAAADAQSKQTLRDYQLMIEYKQLTQTAPRGVYVLPSFDDLRTWHGVIFVRRGHYAGGIFKFRYELPLEYPSEGSRPRVTFTSRVFHPRVHPESGELELHSAFPRWDPSAVWNHSVLTFVKKIFYLKDFAVEFPYSDAANEMWKRDDKREYLHNASKCVQESLERRYANADPASSIRMAPPMQQHEALRQKLVARATAEERLAAVVGAEEEATAAAAAAAPARAAREARAAVTTVPLAAAPAAAAD